MTDKELTPATPEEVKEFIARIKEESMQIIAHSMPDSIAPIGCQCGSPMYLCRNTVTGEWGGWCAECGRGGPVNSMITSEPRPIKGDPRFRGESVDEMPVVNPLTGQPHEIHTQRREH